jgi:hypothetical protein
VAAGLENLQFYTGDLFGNRENFGVGRHLDIFAVQDKGGDSDLIQFIYWKNRMSAKIVEQTFFSRFPAEAAGIRA